jgi:Xaa-Pro aminopeptidase
MDVQRMTPKLKTVLRNNGVRIEKYDALIAFLSGMKESESILIDPHLCNMAVYESVNGKIVHGTSIPKGLKAIKNSTEQQHIRKVMKKDGAALAETFYWLEKALLSGTQVTEYTLAEQLARHRSGQKLYQGESFSAIVGYKGNGAIIHYRPEKETAATILPDGILLVDSGGQYLDGTTDITRTFALSVPTNEQKKVYTLILKGLVSLSKAIFPEGTMGVQLDTFARQHLWANGLNYGHGTGHGVGFFLNVHEPPQGFAPGISERGKTPHVPGMLSSNEPGYYKPGEFGMRLENLILAQQASIAGYLEFETVTLYPFEHQLIDVALLTKEERGWLNAYHKKVYAMVGPMLKPEVRAWFKEKCRKV